MSKHFVLDTNVVVSAVLLKQSVSRKAFDKATSEGKIILSEVVIAELNEVLKREKFNKYITEQERLEFLATLISQAVLIEVTITITDCRDAKDNKFLELAVSGNATYIISGDEALLALHPFREIPILTPHDFVEAKFE